ncbi:MAG TPA: hypothetical protein DDX01_04560, partial [Holosporales bacterium]|nr:hypothetical protein [Holosporales bacterium]
LFLRKKSMAFQVPESPGYSLERKNSTAHIKRGEKISSPAFSLKVIKSNSCVSKIEKSGERLSPKKEDRASSKRSFPRSSRCPIPQRPLKM